MKKWDSRTLLVVKEPCCVVVCLVVQCFLNMHHCNFNRKLNTSRIDLLAPTGVITIKEYMVANYKHTGAKIPLKSQGVFIEWRPGLNSESPFGYNTDNKHHCEAVSQQKWSWQSSISLERDFLYFSSLNERVWLCTASVINSAVIQNDEYSILLSLLNYIR